MIAFHGNQMMNEMDTLQSLGSSLEKKKHKEPPQNRVSDRLSSSETPWSLLRQLWKAVTSVPLRIPSSLQQNTSMTPRRLKCCVCQLHHKWAMKSPASVRQFFKTLLQQVCPFQVDVIAGDANAATYKYYTNQEYSDLHDSSDAT